MIIVPLYLVTLAVGYWVLTISQSQQRPLDVVGRVVGFVIMLVAFFGLVCTSMCRMNGGSCGSNWCGAPRGDAGCGMMKKAACPMMDKTMADPAQAPQAK
jgi:hypothetical protein